MSLSSLQVLANNRDALLLAEVAGLLHDVGKFCNLHIESHTQGGTRSWSNEHAYKAIADAPGNRISLQPSVRQPDALKNILKATSPKAADFLPDTLKNFLATNAVTFLGETYALDELMMLGTPGFATSPGRANLLTGKSGWLAAVLGVCHNEAHVDKQEPARGEGQQVWPNVFISTAFGLEKETLDVSSSKNSLDARLKNLKTDRQSILQAFQYGLGDTRRPINEVLLSDWGWMVASLFKSALAGALLTNQQYGVRQWQNWQDKIIDHDLHWRLLRVNFDVLGLYAKAVRIADLLGYQQAVEDACKQVKQLVEWEYPLGNEVYRDTTGIYFTFPDLGLLPDLAQEIRRRVEAVEPELAPRIAVTVGTGQTATEQLKGILAKARSEALQALSQPFDSENLTSHWQDEWNRVGAGQWEVCPVCRLRPMREGRQVCNHCEGRRGSRITDWRNNPQSTIWIDEIADVNGRVALLVGRFGLEDWLSGDRVQTMLVRADPANNIFTPKNPSPARLRRVWETCQRFWTEMMENVLAQYDYSRGDTVRCARWLLIPEGKTDWKANVPYDGTVNGKAISLLWDEQTKSFVTISNLQWVGAITPEQAISVADPDAPSHKITFTVQSVVSASGNIGTYVPYLSLLASPDQFLAFIPAADALEIAGKIREEYTKQFGKVQNRLPLLLGIVFFPHKMPLLAVMDTARRMLEAPLGEETWQVAQDVTNGQVQFTNGICWDVPVVMGDGRTSDEWYPYYFVKQADPARHPRRFQLRRAGDTDPQKVGAVSPKYADRWLVHVNDLKRGDEVYVTPSRFTYLWLEHTGRRFAFDPAKDLLLLDELPRLITMWQALKQSGITDTALHNVWSLLEVKGSKWDIKSAEFQRLVETALKDAGLYDRRDTQGNPLPNVVTWEDVRDGRFGRCLELYVRILKQKLV
ncbi:MAG: CRISPR-associated protein Csx11 [Anaerolineae bacterium]|nr:CRISPR-associated protein Csx11 [Anaerolineae bacterium]